MESFANQEQQNQIALQIDDELYVQVPSQQCISILDARIDEMDSYIASRIKILEERIEILSIHISEIKQELHKPLETLIRPVTPTKPKRTIFACSKK